jgi:DNA gyrase subunit B
VLSVRRVVTEGPVDVCDLSVSGLHNYRLASGVYAHNSHIECLLLAFFLKHMRPLIEGGNVYIGLPPLYRVTERGKRTYLRDDAALAEFFTERAKASVGDDAALLALAGASAALSAAVSAGGPDEADPAGALAEAITEGRESQGCEGVEGAEVSEGVFVVSGLEPGGRYFTTVVTAEFVAAAERLYWAAVDLVGEGVVGEVADRRRTVAGRECWHLLDYLETVEREVRRGVSILRIKGLGEMNDEELGATTLDPSARRLIQVRVSDFDEAGAFVGSMMSKGTVDARRRVIEESRIGREEVDA